MERVIRSVGPSGKVFYLCAWRSLLPGCYPTASWTPKQSKAKRYTTRSAARADLAKVLEDGMYDGDEDKVRVVRLLGVLPIARTLVAAARLAKELRERPGAPKRARKASENVVIGTFERLAAMVERIDRRRKG